MGIKVLLVDDYNIFRSGLKHILKDNEEFEIVGEVSGADELSGILKVKKADVIVLNLMLPARHVITISKKLSKNYPGIPFILLTFGANEYVIMECLIKGASGILWKESTAEQLLEAIKTVVSGQKYLNVPESKITSNVLQYAHVNHFDKHDCSELSEREQEVLKLFAEGNSYKFIADKLNISPRTVESHKNNILLKLELENTIDMVKYAIKHGLIEI